MNNNSGVGAVALPNGWIVLIFNNVLEGRSPLTLALSTDEGASFVRMRNIVPGLPEELARLAGLRTKRDQQYAEFSYPTIVFEPARGANASDVLEGHLHCVYTCDRTSYMAATRVGLKWLLSAKPISSK